MVVISSLSLHSGDTFKLSEILSQKVIAKDGSELGILSEMYIDPSDMKVAMIKVDKGIFREPYYVGSEFIDEMSPFGIILSITPAQEFKGKPVYDKKGKKIGNVSDVKTSSPTNELLMIIVRNRLTGEMYRFNEDEIERIGEGVLLHVPV